MHVSSSSSSYDITVSLAFGPDTATREALAVVNNETSLYYRCHQMMPVFNQTFGVGQIAPTTWEDRQCVTRYPPPHMTILD
jgi:hypothetical protein